MLPGHGRDPRPNLSLTAGSSSVDAYEAARAWASRWSQEWFLDGDGNDLFRIGGVDAGWATHVEAFLILQQFALAELGHGAARMAPSLTRTLKSHGWDRALRSVALRVGRWPVPHPHPLAAIVEIPTPSMLEPIALLAGAVPFGELAVGTSDARAARELRRRGVDAIGLSVDVASELRLLSAARRVGMGAWRKRLHHPPRMPLRGKDASNGALQALRPLATRSIPWVAVEHQAVKRFLESVSPRAVAISSDQHRIGRVTVAAARSLGIPTIVLQHGLPQAPIGFLPVVADKVATWSVESSKWFEVHGTPERRLEVTGNPRLDLLYTSAPPSSSRATILVALSPTAESTNIGVVEGAIAALDLLPSAEVVVKLHPGQSDWSAVERLATKASDRRIVLRRHEPLYPLLARASVTLLHRSSVAVESLAAHRPVIVYAVGDAPTTADLELRRLALPVVASPHDLARAVTALMDGDEVTRYFSDRQGDIERVIGPTSGSNAARIAALLTAMNAGGEPLG